MLFKEKPYLFEALKGLGLVELHQGNLNKALYFYKKALSLNPKEYSIYIDIGNVYQALKKYKIALKWYKKALIKKELKPFVFTNLALLYLKQGKILLAKKYARLVILNTNKKNNMLGLKQKMKYILKINNN
jgi:tetratricopeptide (TPR) repeat protein